MALDLFLKKYENHPLGNPMQSNALDFYEEKRRQRENRLKLEHHNALETEWTRIRKAVDAGGDSAVHTAVKTVSLFLKKYEGHPLGNTFETEAQELLDDLKAGKGIQGGGDGGSAGGKGKAGIEWIRIRGGSFMMGSEDGSRNEQPVHRVVVKDFYMSKTEVTVGQYRKCVEAGVCSKPDSCNWTDSIGSKENHPINCVDWKQARTFAKWVGGDLPSEAQWEYASRSGGQDIKYPWGNAEPRCEIANYHGCGGKTTPVCSKTGGNTAQGLCDMGGNVWEWVLDEYHSSYSGAPSDDIGWCSDRGCYTNTSARHVYRGGGWYGTNSGLRSAHRNGSSSGLRDDYVGFRVSDLVH
jgi:formylglycine-generating enzyme required for sulfatase activity